MPFREAHQDWLSKGKKKRHNLAKGNTDREKGNKEIISQAENQVRLPQLEQNEYVTLREHPRGKKGRAARITQVLKDRCARGGNGSGRKEGGKRRFFAENNLTGGR